MINYSASGYTLAFIFLFFSMAGNGQVKGKIVDASSQPLPFCQVGLIKANDSSLVNSAISDDKGNFQIQSNMGSYRVSISYIGYKTYYSAIFSITGGSKEYDLGIIKLESEAKTLKDVTITAQKPFVEYKPDKTVYNIENSIMASGNNVLDILRKLPGVKIDNDDNISVNGENGVLVMIDGRITYMSPADLSNYLSNLNASQIEKIEVITNPSAKYDASGNTVINIVRKRDKNAGLNIQLSSSYSQGVYGGGSEGINASYVAKKWSFYMDYGYNFNQTMKYFGGIKRFSTNDIVSNVFADSLLRKQANWGNSGRFEADFLPDKKQTIAVIFEGAENYGIVDKNFPSYMYNGNMQLDSSLVMMAHRTFNNLTTSYGLNYDFKIDSTGKELSADFNYGYYTSGFTEFDVTGFYDSLGRGSRAPTMLQYSLPTTVNVWAVKIDYQQPLGKHGNFEAGIKGSYVTTDNNAQYWNVLNGVYSVDTTFANDFKYSEYIYAGYVSYSQTLNNKAYFQIGLRGEATEGKGVQVIHDTTFSRNYFNLFPSALVSYKLDTNNTLKVNYRRRIWRPAYQQLNPFVYFINQYSYDEGNPALQPQISNSVYITEEYKQRVSISIGDEYWTNPINDITIQNSSTFITYDIPENLNSFNNFYGKVEATLPFGKWFTSMSTFLLMQQKFEGYIQSVYFMKSGLTWNYNMVNMISLGKGWNCEIDFNYFAPQLAGPVLYNPYYVVEAGIKKSFANERGVVALNCSDIFWSERYIDSEVFSGENFEAYEYYDSRRLRLTLSWKIGKSERERQERAKAAEEELNRIR